MVTHVHGAHVDTASDGYPEAWWLPAASDIPLGYASSGTHFNDATWTNPGDLGYADFTYSNDQSSTTLWYHDHTLGITRLNVYAASAGFWLIRTLDDGETGLVSGVLPGPAPTIYASAAALNTPRASGSRRRPGDPDCDPAQVLQR
jgi:FtsP/CotA-like multicopper oxidase with cupredoxin domain